MQRIKNIQNNLDKEEPSWKTNCQTSIITLKVIQAMWLAQG